MLHDAITAVLALALLTVLPGPDVAVVTQVSLAGGPRAGRRAAAGISTGLLVWGAATVAGLSALLAASATAYAALKTVGAVYLVVIGVLTVLRARRGERPPVEAQPGASLRPFRRGLVNDLLNPKIAIFYTAVLPQLAPAELPHAVGLAGLVLVHAAITVAWLSFYGALVSRSAAAFQHPRAQRALEAVTGVVLVAFGVRVAAE